MKNKLKMSPQPLMIRFIVIPCLLVITITSRVCIAFVASSSSVMRNIQGKTIHRGFTTKLYINDHENSSEEMNASNHTVTGSEVGVLFWMLNKLDGDLKELKGELKGDLKELKGELKGDLKELKGELKGDLNKLDSKLEGGLKELKGDLKGDLKELKGDLDTKLTLIIALLGVGLAAPAFFSYFNGK